MGKFFFVLAALARTGHARQVQFSTQVDGLSLDKQIRAGDAGNPSKAMAMLFLTITPAAAFNPPGSRVPAFNGRGVPVVSMADESGITLTTRTLIKGMAADIQQDFLATPSKWPSFVLSSASVEDQPEDDRPMRPKDTVKEVFGLPPVLPLFVEWECQKNSFDSKSQNGILDMVSEKGLAGIASGCRMRFSVSQRDADIADVQLEMSFQPESPLALAAIPALVLDNTLALKVLLPRVVAAAALPPVSNVKAFTTLVGTLYGGAGLAHAVDLASQSVLLTFIGLPPFQDLPTIGQAAAVLWCAVGALSYWLTRQSAPLPALGLLAYGLVEVACAVAADIFVDTHPPVIPPELWAPPNAIGVQVAVVASYLYCKSRDELDSAQK